MLASQVAGADADENVLDQNNLLKSENKFLMRWSETGECALLPYRIDAIISNSFKDLSYSKQLPVALIAVLGSDERSLRKYHTDWLIRHFEKNEQSIVSVSSRKMQPRKKFLFLNKDSYMITSGVYIWPKPYILPSAGGTGKEMICWIIHVDGPFIDVLEKFVALACSEVIVFQQTDKDFYSALTKNSQNKLHSKLPSYHIYPNTHMAISDGSDVDDSHRQEFCNYLARMPISALVDDSGLAVTLDTFVKYLHSVVRVTNAQFGSESGGFGIQQKLEVPIPSPRRDITTQQSVDSQYNEGTSIDVEVTKTDKEMGKKHVNIKAASLEEENYMGRGPAIELVSTSHVPSSNNKLLVKSISADGAGVTRTHDFLHNVPCEKLNCSRLQKSLIPRLTSWIKSSMKPTNINKTLDCVRSYKSIDSHNIFGELGDMVNIVIVFSNEISNMFDNYVCFEGEIDKVQIQRFGDNAHRSAEKALKEKKHIHSQLTSNIFNYACDVIRSIFSVENEWIVQCENRAAAELNLSVIRAYKSKMKLYIKQNPKIDEIKVIHKILANHCILMVDRCMDAQARINGVVKVAIELLKSKLDNEFEGLIGKIAIPPPMVNQNDNPIEYSISVYLNLFNSRIKPKLENFDLFQLTRYHHDICNSAVLNMKNIEKEIALFRFESHSVYITEVEQVRRTTARESSFQKKESHFPLCIYFTRKWLRVDALIEPQKYRTLRHAPGNINQLPAVAAVTWKDSILLGEEAENENRLNYRFLKEYDTLVNFLTRYAPNSRSDFVLTQLFRKVKSGAEESFKRPYLAAVVTIPRQFNVWNRLCLRQVIHQAGFEQVYLVSESSLAVYSILESFTDNLKKANDRMDIAVVINIEGLGIRFEVYKWCERDGIGKCKLLAGAFQDWQNSSLCSEHSLQNGQYSERQTVTNPFGFPEHQYKNCVKTMEMAFENVKCQMLASLQEKRTPYIIISEKPEKEIIFYPFFKLHPYLLRVDGVKENQVVTTALEFSKEPHKITHCIVDHAAHIDNILPNIVTPPKENSDTLSLEGCKEFSITSTPVFDTELENIKSNLVAQCDAMKSQIHEAKVKIRVLMKKLVLDAIQRAEATAANAHATKVMVKAQQDEISELFDEHNFTR